MPASRWLFAAASLPAASSRWCIPSGRLLALPELVAVPASHSLPRCPRPATLPRRPCQQLFPMALCCSAPAGSPLCRRIPACNSFATAPRPATNLIRQRSTPVWLAIWRTWAGFANSQHRDAAFATPDNICAHSSLLQTLSCCSDRRKSVDPSAPIAYATSVSLTDEAVAWPGRRYPMGDKAVAWPDAAFLQITARTNPRSRHLWGTLARAVASI